MGTNDKCPDRFPDTKKWSYEKRAEFMQENMPLIKTAVGRFKIEDPAVSREDLIQEAQIAFWHAYDMYDPSKQTAFTSYAFDLMKKHLLYSVRGINAQKRKPAQPPVSLNGDEEEPDSFITPDNWNIPDTISDINANPTEDMVLRKEELALVYRELARYNKEYQYVFLNLALKTKTQKELAEEMHCSQGKISMMYSLIRVQLCYDLRRMGYTNHES